MAAAQFAIGPTENDTSKLEAVKPADPRVIEIGQFVVTQVHHGRLIFVGVLGGFTWKANEGNYYAILIENQDFEGATFIHKALVFETN